MGWAEIVALSIKLAAQVDWLQVFALVVSVLFILSEILATIDVVESNSVFQAIQGILEKIKEKFPFKKDKPIIKL